MFQYWSVRISVACALVFLLQGLMEPLTDELALVSGEVLVRPWTLITSIFAHADPLHLAYNMLALLLFGSMLERIVGGRKFLAVYFGAGLAGSFAALPFYTASLGASGAIFGAMGALAVLRPRMVVYISYVPMPMILAVAVWALIDFTGLFFPSGTANAAHLAGLAVGLLAGAYLKRDYGERPMGRRKPPQIPEKEIRTWENRWLIGKKA
ncbi:MAG: rhomboid family intramembrane serine protease [Candidatus Aenigmatarchaeota archaeon]